MASLQKAAIRELAKREVATRKELDKPPIISDEAVKLIGQNGSALISAISAQKEQGARMERALSALNKTLSKKDLSLEVELEKPDLTPIIKSIEILAEAMSNMQKANAIALANIAEKIENIQLVTGAEIVRDKDGLTKQIKYMRN